MFQVSVELGLTQKKFSERFFFLGIAVDIKGKKADLSWNLFHKRFLPHIVFYFYYHHFFHCLEFF